MSIATTTLGPTGIKVAKAAHGLMLMTWTENPVPDEQCFESIKAGLDLAGPGEKVVLNTGEIYGFKPRVSNLLLLNRFFEKYPEYKEKAFISVKGGTTAEGHAAVSTAENLRRSVVDSQKALGSKKIDLFQSARVDPTRPIEEAIANLKVLVEEGLIDHIGISEAKADTVRRANTVHPIAAIEIEISPWCYEEETKKVIALGKELGIAVFGYSPLGNGFLTGNIKKENVDPSEHRFHNPRWQEEAAAVNEAFVETLTKISSRIGISNAQLCIAWVASLGEQVIPLPGSSKASRTVENIHSAGIKLSEADLKEIQAAIDTFKVQGERYPSYVPIWG